MELAGFGIHTEISLADSIRKTCCKWVIDDFMKCSDNNLIILLIMNIEAESTTYMEESLTICHHQINELNCLHIGNIYHVNNDIVSL